MRTAESVTEGHPDKVCDQISDAILDEHLKVDPRSRVAVECLGGHGLLSIIGEVTSKADVNVSKLAKKIYRQIGYEDELEIVERIVKQSPDIAMGVDDGGAGDQGIMYGFATRETRENMPLPLTLSHQITKKLSQLRKRDKRFNWLGPDGKSQSTVNDKSVKILISCQHKADAPRKKMRGLLLSEVVEPLVKKYNLKLKQFLFNPTGQFIIGGFEGDTGLTGRKIMVDTYGGLAPAGGGAFSGKDPTKVDRSAAYMARYLAKNILRKEKLKECQVALAYAIGKADPVMVTAHDENGQDYSKKVTDNFDLSPAGIIKFLDLRKPQYFKTAKNGHFGHSNFSWEKVS